VGGLLLLSEVLLGLEEWGCGEWEIGSGRGV